MGRRSRPHTGRPKRAEAPPRAVGIVGRLRTADSLGTHEALARFADSPQISPAKAVFSSAYALLRM